MDNQLFDTTNTLDERTHCFRDPESDLYVLIDARLRNNAPTLGMFGFPGVAEGWKKLHNLRKEGYRGNRITDATLVQAWSLRHRV
jgi:hypothetical protein